MRAHRHHHLEGLSRGFGKSGPRAFDLRRWTSDMSGGNPDKVAATQLFERVGTIVGREDQVQDALLGRNNVNVIVGTAASKDSHKLMINSSQGERRATAADIMIAVGPTLATPAETILDSQRILTSDKIFSLKDNATFYGGDRLRRGSYPPLLHSSPPPGP